MVRQDALADSVMQSRGLMGRYLAGFDDTNHTATAVHLPNHVAWVLGHCALTMHRAAERVDGRFEPGDAFLIGEQSGDPRRFGTESVAFGSDPRAAGAVFPPMARCAEVFTAATERLAGALRGCPDPVMDELVSLPGGVSLPRWTMGPRMVFHNGLHCGQVVDLRRALRMPGVMA